MIDVKEVKKQAEEEFNEERVKAAKDKVKAQLKRVMDAERILKNEKLLLDDIYAQIGS